MSSAALPTLVADRNFVDDALESTLRDHSPHSGSPVAAAMRFAVLNGGQRLRPVLALRIGRLSNADLRLVTRGAVATELFHCASLIVDDLPCMDDEMMRRGQPTVHRQFGEATALLAAFSLVALAARHATEGVVCPAEAEHLSCFQQKLLRVLDCNSLVGGQAMDLAAPGASSRRLAELKTAPLFQLSAWAGLLGSPFDEPHRHQLSQFGHEFGVSYQLMDDLNDGHASSRAEFEQQLAQTRSLLHPFAAKATEIHEMLDYLENKSIA
ncbi:MAG: polyprenyl synthetase family protein [Acidobacteriota bacterium]